MRITYTSGPAPRPKPKVGDRRTTKKHGLQIRVWSRARDTRGNAIGMLVRGSRPMFEWVKPHELEKWDEYLLTAEEKAQVERVRFARAHCRDIEAAIMFGTPAAPAGR